MQRMLERLETRSYFSAGTLDLSSLSQWTNRSTSACAVAFAGGKTLVAGYLSTDHGDDFAVARFNADGAIDSTFGLGGWAIVDFGSTFDQAYAIAVDGSGRMVVAGQTNVNGSFDFAVARLTGDGALDGTFGAGGKVIVDFEGQFDQATALAISGEKIYIGGSAMKDWVSGFGLVRLNGDGALDGGFGAEGKALVVWNDIGAEATAIAVQADGKIVQVGYVANLVDPIAWTIDVDMAVVRYNPDGSLDGGFGGGGKVMTDFGRDDDHAQAVAIQSDGMIVVGGYSADTSGPADFALARLTGAGVLDGSFGSGGKVVTDFAGGQDRAFSLAIRSDGKIVMGGSSSQGLDLDFALIQYNSDGTLDGDFGSGGRLTVSLGGTEMAQGMTFGTDGKLAVVGTVSMADGWKFAGLVQVSDKVPLPPPPPPPPVVVTKTVELVVEDGQQVLHVNAGDGTDVVVLKRSKKTGKMDVVLNGVSQGLFQTDKLIIQAGGGDDFVHIDDKLMMSVVVYGGDGNDHIDAGGGNATLYGGSGNDHLRGGIGTNLLNGGEGNDKLMVPEKNEHAATLLGGAGNDVLIGGAGDDLLDGGDGNDALHGRKGRDSVFAGAGKDHVNKDKLDLVDDPDTAIKVKKAKRK